MQGAVPNRHFGLRRRPGEAGAAAGEGGGRHEVALFRVAELRPGGTYVQGPREWPPGASASFGHGQGGVTWASWFLCLRGRDPARSGTRLSPGGLTRS